MIFILVDAHCDTIKNAYKDNLYIDNAKLKFNITEAKTPMLQMMAIYISPEEAEEGFEIATNIIRKFEKELNKFKDKVAKVKDYKDIQSLEKTNRIGLMLTAENGSIINGNLNNVDCLYDKGVRVMSITWNYNNDLGTGALETIDNGLTSLGEKYIEKLNDKNIIVDVSHSSEKTFWDTANISKKPIVATHSCVYNICNHPRNLRDEQIKRIAKKGGIIGIPFCSPFLRDNGKANVKDVVKHIKYIRDLVGVDYVGLGSDFDGVEDEDLLTDITRVKDIEILEQELKKQNFSSVETEKIMGDNWIKFFRKTLVKNKIL